MKIPVVDVISPVVGNLGLLQTRTLSNDRLLRQPGAEMLHLLMMVAAFTHTSVLLGGLFGVGGAHTPLWEMVFAAVSISALLLWRFSTPLVHRGIVMVLLTLVATRWSLTWLFSNSVDILATTVSGLLYLPLLLPIAQLTRVSSRFSMLIIAIMALSSTAAGLHPDLVASTHGEWRIGPAIVMGYAVFMRFQSIWMGQLEQLNRMTEDQAVLARAASVDDLTGLMNRRIGQLQLAHTLRSDTPASCLLVDLDHFKSINDNHGHPVGDTVLRRVSKVMRQSCRSSDTLCRWGGEEFLIILENTPEKSALHVAEHIRRSVEQRTRHDEVPVTISIGVAQHVSGDTVDSWVTRADAALYDAKEGGRNRVEPRHAA